MYSPRGVYIFTENIQHENTKFLPSEMFPNSIVFFHTNIEFSQPAQRAAADLKEMPIDQYGKI